MSPLCCCLMLEWAWAVWDVSQTAAGASRPQDGAREARLCAVQLLTALSFAEWGVGCGHAGEGVPGGEHVHTGGCLHLPPDCNFAPIRGGLCQGRVAQPGKVSETPSLVVYAARCVRAESCRLTAACCTSSVQGTQSDKRVPSFDEGIQHSEAPGCRRVVYNTVLYSIAHAVATVHLQAPVPKHDSCSTLCLFCRYYEGLKDRPTVKKTWPPHWLEGPGNGRLAGI